MVAEPVVISVRGYLAALADSGMPVSFGVVFGSQAVGHADQWSDIDLVVVSPVFDRPFGRQDVTRLWHVAARTDSRIEPIPCGDRQWLEDDSSLLLEIARREGYRVNLRVEGPEEQIYSA